MLNHIKVVTILATLLTGCFDGPTSVELETTDWKNRSYSLACGADGSEQRRLREGTLRPKGGDMNGELLTVEYGDVTADGSAEAVVMIACSAAGGNETTNNILVFEKRDSTIAQLGQTIEDGGYDPKPFGQGLTATKTVYGPDDPECCPSGTERVVYMLLNERWVMRD